LIPGKKLLIDAMGDLLPEETWNRKKMGFTLPWKMWMKKELASFCEEHIQRLAKRDIVNGVKLIDMWVQFKGGDPVIPWTRIWHLVVLNHWLEKNNVE
jgi:asparagine synthase (glutamine-hydrolysing)